MTQNPAGLPKPSWRETLARYLGYLLVAITFLETLAAILYIVLSQSGPNVYNYAAIFYGVIAFVLLTYADMKKKERLGLPVSRLSRDVVTLGIASLWLWTTFAVLAGIDYTLLHAPPLTATTIVSMLNDLITFDGVLVGFTSVIVGMDLSDLAKEDATPKSAYHQYLIRRRNWGINTLFMLSLGTLISWISIPWAAANPQVGYLALPIQPTVLGIGMLLGRMIGYRPIKPPATIS